MEVINLDLVQGQAGDQEVSSSCVGTSFFFLLLCRKNIYHVFRITY